MRDNRKLSPNSISSYISAIQTFLVINDFGGINWTKVKKFVGEFYKVADDRPYTRDEIKQLVDAAHSIRDKAIILLLNSSCMRVGGLVRLQLKHLIPNDKYGTYQIDVYKKSREAYTTFCTPETRAAIDLYLDWRTRLGETLTSESPLFRVGFDTRFGARSPAKQMNRTLVCRILKLLRDKTGIVKAQHLTDSVKRGKSRSHIKTLQGLRKYLSTCLDTAGVNAVFVELLLGQILTEITLIALKCNRRLLAQSLNQCQRMNSKDFGSVNEYERHVVIKHPKLPCYSGPADIQYYYLERQVSVWITETPYAC
jgi:integrase